VDAFLAEGDAYRAEGGANPAEGDAYRAEGDANPAKGDANPAEGDANPAEGDAYRAEGDAYCAEGDAYRAEGDANPAEGDANPAEGDAYPAEGDAYRAEGDAYRAEGDAYRAEGDAYRAEGDANPAEGDAYPAEVGRGERASGCRDLRVEIALRHEEDSSLHGCDARYDGGPSTESPGKHERGRATGAAEVVAGDVEARRRRTSFFRRAAHVTRRGGLRDEDAARGHGQSDHERRESGSEREEGPERDGGCRDRRARPVTDDIHQLSCGWRDEEAQRVHEKDRSERRSRQGIRRLRQAKARVGK